MATIYVDENKNIHALDSIIDSLPVGSIVLWPSNTAPAGWFICNGDAISRTKYEDLFSVVGISYGPGDNSTTFNLPDFRGRTPVGVNDGTGSVSETFSLASSGGEVTHTLTINEMPSHSHGISANAHISSQAHSSGEARWPWTDWQEANRATWNAGGGQAHNNMQPYLVVNYIIKAFYSVSASGGQGGDASSDIIIIGNPSDVTPDTKLLVEPEDVYNSGTEVINSMDGNETTKAPSVAAVKSFINNDYSTSRVKVGTWTNGKGLYRKVLTGTKVSGTNLLLTVDNDADEIVFISEAKISNASSHGYVIPFYESSEVFVRLELQQDVKQVKIVSGTSAYSNGDVELAVLYTIQESPFKINQNYAGMTMNMSFPNNTTFTGYLYDLSGGEQGENTLVSFGNSAITADVDAAAGTIYYDLRFYQDINDISSYTRLFAASYTSSTGTWSYNTNLSTFTLPATLADCNYVNANAINVLKYITLS